MPILTDQDHQFFRENGYVRVRRAVPEENCQAVIDAIWEFTGKDPNDPEGWYTPPEGMSEPWKSQSAGMIELYQHQALWDNRQHPNVYQAFAELLGEKALLVSLDRCNMKPPKRDDHPEYDYGFIHWDLDPLALPRPLPDRPYGLQGVLYLADTTEDQGGFQCVPSVYRDLEAFLDSFPEGPPRSPDLRGHKVEVVPGEAGDLVIWDRLLLHGNGHNLTDRPRFAQYITMYPASRLSEASRQARIDSWRNRRAGPHFPGDPRQWEEKYGKTAELTPLGRKLLGLDAWD